MHRRHFLAATAAALARPAIVRAAAATTLRFVPYADLALLDPILTTNYVTRTHALLVFDTLYGFDGQFRAQPQMVAGHTVEEGGKLWRLTLREGLRFHDGTPVLARDCVASIRRWAPRDSFGSALLAATDELSSPDDRTIQFRLNRPFPLLPEALGKTSSYVPVMMPARLAATPPTTAVPELVGSGPYRFDAAERVPGALAVYRRFDGYVPRPDGTVSFTAGPRIAHRQQPGATDQRQVVKMDDVGLDLRQQAANRAALERRSAGLMGRQRRERSGGAPQGVDRDPLRDRVRSRALAAAHEVEGVAAVDDVDGVTVAGQRPRKAIDERGVSAEAVLAEEGGEHAERHVTRPSRTSAKRGAATPRSRPAATSPTPPT